MNTMIRLSLLGAALAAALAAGGCASSADRQPLVNVPTSARPGSGILVPASVGSLFPAAAGRSAGYRPLFEDSRARAVGDTLTVVLNESTAATKLSNNTIERKASNSVTTGVINKLPFSGALGNLGISGSGDIKSEGTGNAAASNVFNGTITVTVIEVLPNGNLLVAGEKQLAISSEEEVIRFSGVVNPITLTANTVSSSQVADARIEYRGRGAADDALNTGWLNRLLLKVSPL